MVRLLLAAFLLALLGCSSVDPGVDYDLNVSSSFSAAAAEDVLAAARKWEEAAPVHFRTRIVDDPAAACDGQVHCIAVYPVDSLLKDDRGQQVGEAERWDSSDVAHVRVWSGVDSARKRTMTVAHELGHAMGLGHSDEQGQLMYPTTDGAVDKVTDGDVAEFCRLRPGKC